ncbi:MAG: Xaa-Pro aminopeptidase [Deltaproteobacteria bacterium]|nr:Xaa-Pro aminopeptidase [Deltaproteobacteria bacterium]
MISREFHRSRREVLALSVSSPILLMGNGHRARNLPMNRIPFRQDSSFLYCTGCHEPNAALMILDGESILFLEDHPPDDALWHGPTASLEDRKVVYGVDRVEPITSLEEFCSSISAISTIAVADEQINSRSSQIVGSPLSFGADLGSISLIDGLIAMRRILLEEEIVAIRKTMETTRRAHIAAIQATEVGGHERLVAAAFHYELAKDGLESAYHSIVTVHGEILHNESYQNPLCAGQLLLLDGGAEAKSGYANDITRTWPVSREWTPKQTRAYSAVLQAQKDSIAQVVAGNRYRNVHDASSRVIASFLRDEGLLRISEEEAVERGAHALFFPHGIGHLLGLDVHDMENFGDRPSYPVGRSRSDQFGTGYLRMDLDLVCGMLVTVEPGFYVVPSILNNRVLRDRFYDAYDWEKVEEWTGFGGIRIEDNVLCTQGVPDVLSSDIPKEIEEINTIRS